jgi:predicted DNA-binding ribbon-helix-helix protein
LLLFFKKEVLFFFEKKRIASGDRENQKTFICWSLTQPVLVKRSFSLAGHRTSAALEPEFWQALAEIASASDRKVAALVAEIDAERQPEQPLASALRVFALLRRG